MTNSGSVKTSQVSSPAIFLRGVRIVFTRELAAIFDSPVAYVYFIAFTIVTSAIFMNNFFIKGVLDMAPYFEMLPVVSIIFMPALTMRVWAEEKRVMTFELLMTLPLTSAQTVIGKFLSVFIYYALALLGSLPIVVMMNRLGSPDNGAILSGYAGAVMLGALTLALGVFMSSVTNSQIVAFVLTAFAAFVLVFTGNDLVVSVLDGLAPSIQMGTMLYENVSLVPRFEAFVGGLISLSDCFYFVALSAVFLYMNVLVVDRSRP